MNRIQKNLITLIVIIGLAGTILMVLILNERSTTTQTVNTGQSEHLNNDTFEGSTVSIYKQLSETPQKDTNRFTPKPYIFRNNFYTSDQIDQLYSIVDPSLHTFQFTLQFSNENYDQSYLIVDIFIQGKLKDGWISEGKTINCVVYESYVTNQSILRFVGDIKTSFDEESNLTINIDGSLYDHAQQGSDSFDIVSDEMSRYHREYKETETYVGKIDFLYVIDKKTFDNSNYILTPISLN